MGCSENPQLIKLIVMAQFAQMFPLLYLLSQHTYESVDSVQTSNNPSSLDTKGLDSQERLRPHFPPPLQKFGHIGTSGIDPLFLADPSKSNSDRSEIGF